MAYEQKEGQGSMFVNDQQGNPNRPNYKGSIMIGGQMYWLSGWLKQAQSGQQFISISVQLQQPRPQTPQGGFPQQGFQATGQFPGQPMAPQYPQQPQGYQQAPAPQYPQQPQGYQQAPAPQYPQNPPQYPQQGQPQNPFGGQFPPQGGDDMPAF